MLNNVMGNLRYTCTSFKLRLMICSLRTLSFYCFILSIFLTHSYVLFSYCHLRFGNLLMSLKSIFCFAIFSVHVRRSKKPECVAQEGHLHHLTNANVESTEPMGNGCHCDPLELASTMIPFGVCCHSASCQLQVYPMDHPRTKGRYVRILAELLCSICGSLKRGTLSRSLSGMGWAEMGDRSVKYPRPP